MLSHTRNFKDGNDSLVRDVQGAHEIQSYCLGHTSFVTSCAFVAAPDQTLLASAGGDGTIRSAIYSLLCALVCRELAHFCGALHYVQGCCLGWSLCPWCMEFFRTGGSADGGLGTSAGYGTMRRGSCWTPTMCRSMRHRRPVSSQTRMGRMMLQSIRQKLLTGQTLRRARLPAQQRSVYQTRDSPASQMQAQQIQLKYFLTRVLVLFCSWLAPPASSNLI